MLGIGEELKNRREEKGLTIHDIESETKIKASYIEAIEKENFDKLPGRVYVKGFIKNYAKFLGLDYMRYLLEINKHFSEEQTEDILANSKPHLVKEVRRDFFSGKVKKGISLILILVLMGFGAYRGFEYFKNKPVDPEPPVSVVETPPVAVNPPPVVETPPPAVENPPVVVTPPVVENPTPGAETPPPVSGEGIGLEIIMSQGGPGVESCWIQVIVDGKLEFEQTIFAGRSPIIFTGKEVIDFTYGNGAAIRIKVNGVDQGILGAQGEVGTKRFRAEDF